MILPLTRAVVARTDLWLWGAVALLAPLGVLMVASATATEADASWLTPDAARQGAYALVGAVAMLVASRLDYRVLQRRAVLIYTIALLVLLATILVGVATHGARRWLGTGNVTVQPAEFAKIALALALAAYGASRQPRLSTVLTSLGIAGLPCLLVAAQPDLGTAIVCAGTWVVFAIVWGVPWRTLGGLLAAGVAFGPVAFALAVPAYQRERLAVFLDPARDPLGSGFNLRQVEVAMGTAGVTGHGLFSGAQSHLDSVAARSSDFMFGFIGAELGLLGALFLIGLLALAVSRGFAAAARAPDVGGRLLAVALTGAVLTQGLVNIAVNLRLFPVTGIPLPFISQGGSALVTMLLAVGLLQSVAAHRPVTRAERRADLSS